jgi:hypothetical protein
MFLRCRPLSRARVVFSNSILGLAPQALCFRPLRGLRELLPYVLQVEYVVTRDDADDAAVFFNQHGRTRL